MPVALCSGELKEQRLVERVSYRDDAGRKPLWGRSVANRPKFAQPMSRCAMVHRNCDFKRIFYPIGYSNK
jgi:hypothetical protein